MDISPQKENGFTPIANEIMEELGKINLSPYESRILWIIFRKTYGWKKKVDRISLSQFAESTNISIPHICRSLKKMVAKNIITQIGNGYYVTYSFQKNYKQWKPLPKQVIPPKLLPKQAIATAQTGNSLLPKQADTKETITKETITKDNIYIVRKYFYDRFKEVFGKVYIADFAKDGKIFKDLSKFIPLETLKNIIDSYLTTPDEFSEKVGYTVGLFRKRINSLQIDKKSQRLGEKGLKALNIAKDWAGNKEVIDVNP